MESIDDLFSALGGVTAIGVIIGKRVEHVGSMKNRRSIPVRYWPALVASDRGKEIGLTNDLLVEIHSKELARRRSICEAAE